MSERIRRYVAEAVIGVLVAGLLLWTIVAAGGDIPFVYQGL
jgi:hypothetical protein